MTVDKHTPTKAGRAGRKASRPAFRVLLDPAVLDLVAVVAFALTLVICAARGDSAGMYLGAGGLGTSVLVAAVVRGKPI